MSEDVDKDATVVSPTRTVVEPERNSSSEEEEEDDNRIAVGSPSETSSKSLLTCDKRTEAEALL